MRNGRVHVLGSLIRAVGAPRVDDLHAPMHLMLRDGRDWIGDTEADRKNALDILSLRVHGCATHLDALCHGWTGDRLYNGFEAQTITSAGAERLGVENVGAIVTRGVLVDVAGLHGELMLPADYMVTDNDVADCLGRLGLEVESGDAVLIRTGWLNKYLEDPNAYSTVQPGVGPSAALYLAQREICLLGADNIGVNPRVLGRERPGGDRLNLHVPYLRNMGIYMLELLDLEELARERIYEFLLTVAPLLIDGGTGSPVNPVAVS